jgi:hypothetical protein
MKELKKKVGPLELWQWILILGGSALAFYLYEKKKGETPEVNSEEEEKLLGALEKAGGGGGSAGTETGSFGSQTPVPASVGPEGVPGIAGPAGEAGPQGEAPSAGLEAKVNALEEDVVKNQPPTTSHTGAPQALPKGEFKNAQNGLIERTFTKGNGVFHEYVTGGKGIKKGTVFKVGTVHKPAAKPKRVVKPKPVAHKVAAKKVAAKTPAHKEKKKEPVHR